MMRKMILVVMSGCMLGLAMVAGCMGAAERLNAPPQGETDRPSELQDNYVRMADNAMLKERSMSPVHFVPGTNELNGTGVRRLKRYATLIKVYGGPLHYDGVEDPQELATARIEQIKQFLVGSGVGPDQTKVDLAMAGGNDMRAFEASTIRDGNNAVSQKSEALSEERMRAEIYSIDTEKK